MNSRIEQIMDELDACIENAKYKFMSNTEIVVNKDEIEGLLRELRMKTPDEIKRYQKIISNKEQILDDARRKAQELIDNTEAKTNELLSEHEIIQQAYARADQIVSEASMHAQNTVDKATIEANELRAAAMQYMDDTLADIENMLSAASHQAESNYESLLNNLNHYHDIIVDNRRELHPTEPAPQDTEDLDALD